MKYLEIKSVGTKFLVPLLMTLVALMGIPKAHSQNCEDNITKIWEASQKAGAQNESYLQVNAWIEGDKESMVTSEIWKKGNIYYYKSPFFEMFTNGKEQGIVLHESQKVILKKFTEEELASAPQVPEITEMLDSLKQYSCGLDCAIPGTLTLDFSLEAHPDIPYSKIVLEYDVTTFEMKKGTYTTAPDPYGDSVTQIVEYIKNNKRPAGQSLPGNIKTYLVKATSQSGKYAAYDLVEM